MRRRIYLLRHGDVDYYLPDGTPLDPTDLRLSPGGREQARAAGRALGGVQPDRVITSGLARTVETAQLVLEAAGSPLDPVAVESWPDLQEIQGGPVDTVADEDLQEGFLSAFTGPPDLDARYLFGESLRSLIARVDRQVDRLLDADDWHTVLIVAHGVVNRVILSRSLTGPGTFHGHIDQAPACVNVLDHGPDWSLQGINVVTYQALEAIPRSTTIERILEGARDGRAPVNPPYRERD